MDFAFTAEAGLAGLFLASFLSATLLPGGSEAVLLAVVFRHPDQASAALLLATIGNTLGGMTTWGMGHLIPSHLAPQKSVLVARRGAPILLLAWAPIIGDALCAAAGWLRLPWLPCAVWMALGRARVMRCWWPAPGWPERRGSLWQQLGYQISTGSILAPPLMQRVIVSFQSSPRPHVRPLGFVVSILARPSRAGRPLGMVRRSRSC